MKRTGGTRKEAKGLQHIRLRIIIFWNAFMKEYSGFENRLLHFFEHTVKSFTKNNSEMSIYITK